MNLCVAEEVILEEHRHVQAASEATALVKQLDADCTAFNILKNEVFDHLSACVEALKFQSSDQQIRESANATIKAVIKTIAALDQLFDSASMIYEKYNHGY